MRPHTHTEYRESVKPLERDSLVKKLKAVIFSEACTQYHECGVAYTPYTQYSKAVQGSGSLIGGLYSPPNCDPRHLPVYRDWLPQPVNALNRQVCGLPVHLPTYPGLGLYPPR